VSKSTINVNETVYDDEIDLLELFNIIWNKKILIIIITSLFVLFSVFYALNKTPIYAVKNIFEIGSTNGILVDNVSRLVHEINIIENLNVSADVITKLANIKLIKGANNLIEVTVKSTSNKEGVQLIDQIFSGIQLKHQKSIGDYLFLNNQKLLLATKEFDRLLLDKEKLIVRILGNEKAIARILEDNAAVAAVYVLNLNSQNAELSSLNASIYDLEKEITTIKLSLLPANIKQTKLLGSVIVNDSPIAPRKKLIVILGTLLGFIFSIILVLIMGFVKKHKEND